MKIKLSKANWKKIGRKAGWIKLTKSNIPVELKPYYNIHYVKSPKANPDILTQILSLENNYDAVSINAALNPICPKEILTQILEKGNNDWVSHSVAMNPNCPLEALIDVLKRGNNNEVSYWASKNPKCPIKTKLQWMIDTNRIHQEDPEINKEDPISPIDPDLLKFKQLLQS